MVPQLLRHRPAQAVAARGARNWTALAQPAARSRNCAGWCRSCSTDCSRAQEDDGPAQQNLTALLDETASTASSTSRSARDLRSGRIGLAQNRLPAEHDHRGCRTGGCRSIATGARSTSELIAAWA